ncbi:MAG: LssY C-terminal domain-containing protein [Acidobacteriales bacterium]|nr:LssY C-terminal domain-containing protein [Terriglobales bacterium]
MVARFVTSLLLAGAAALAEMPAGTQIEIRLQTKAGSKISKVQDSVNAVVIAPVLDGGQVAIPRGTTVTGHVKSLKNPDNTGERAELEIEFNELRDSSGGKTKFAALVAAVDNARESVDDKGKIVGILASETLSSRIDNSISKLGARFGKLADLLGAAKQTVIKTTDPEILCEPGVEMSLKLTKALSWKSSARPAAISEISPAEELAALVNAQPFQTVAEKPPKPSDITNIMYIGSKEHLEAAFAAAGWSTAAALSGHSKMETVAAVAEDRGYKEAPMSVLLLDGQKPDLVFQKQYDTFAKRHHLRIFHRPVQFQGRDVWVCSATHDIGIDFSAQDRTFIHKIDSKIDNERTKVVNDLLFTGLVNGQALVERPKVPASSENATGDKLETDGKMAVLLLD